MAELERRHRNQKSASTSDSAIPVSIEQEETRAKILSELIKAEDHYVRKIRSARHSIAHEILSDSSAIIGALTTFQFTYIKSLLAVSPIVGMLLWQQQQAKNDLARLHRVAELFRRTRDPRYFHVLGLELEGIPRSEDLTWEQKKKVEEDINSILKIPVSFGSTLKNLRDDTVEDIDRVGENLRRTPMETARAIGKGILNGGKTTAHFLWETVVDLKNLKTLPANYLKASFVIARQGKDIVYLPLRNQFAKVAKPVNDWFVSFKRAQREEENTVTVARVVRSQTATFATNPIALSREIKRVKESLRRTAMESAVNGVAFACQTAFILNQGLITYHHILQNEWMTAAGVALPSLLALSPLNYFAKNQIEKYNKMKSGRADMAKRLDQHTQTLKAVKMVKDLLVEIQEETDEKTHLKMAKDLVDMFEDDFNPEWFEKEHREKLSNLFDYVAAHREQLAQNEAEQETPAQIIAAPDNRPGQPL